MLANFFMLFMLTLNLYFKKQIHAITSKKVINSEYINILIYVKKNLTMMIKKKCHKDWDPCNFTAKNRDIARNILNSRYKILKEIPAVFHNDSSYDYHFIIKELVEEFARQFKCLKEIHHFFNSNWEKTWEE